MGGAPFSERSSSLTCPEGPNKGTFVGPSTSVEPVSRKDMGPPTAPPSVSVESTKQSFSHGGGEAAVLFSSHFWSIARSSASS